MNPRTDRFNPHRWCNHNALCKLNDTPPSGSRGHRADKRLNIHWTRRQLDRELRAALREDDAEEAYT